MRFTHTQFKREKPPVMDGDYLWKYTLICKDQKAYRKRYLELLGVLQDSEEDFFEDLRNDNPRFVLRYQDCSWIFHANGAVLANGPMYKLMHDTAYFDALIKLL